jgi:hypothetical protein
MSIYRLLFLAFMVFTSGCFQHKVKPVPLFGPHAQKVAIADTHWVEPQLPVEIKQTSENAKAKQSTHVFRVVTKKPDMFNQLRVQGPLNITLSTNASSPRIVLKGDLADLALVRFSVKNGTLSIISQKTKPVHTPLDIQIDAPSDLRSLVYDGAGSIVGHHIRTDAAFVSINNSGNTHLDGQINLSNIIVKGKGQVEIQGVSGQNVQISLIGKPKVQLTGMAEMASLDVQGKAEFSFYWAKAGRLMVRAKEGASRIRIAGAVAYLDVELWGKAQFNGRYLRAERTFIKTHDHAIAEIVTTSRQHTLALDASDIHFYNLPSTRMDFMAKNGAVLDMRDWELRDEQEYTRYNR